MQVNVNYIFFTIYLLSIAPGSYGIDFLQEGRKVIMQKDIDHVLIRLDLSNINSTIGGIVKAVSTVRSNLLRNRLSAKQSATTRQYIKLLDYLAREARIRKNEFEKKIN